MRVAIVGAGFAGLAAAVELSSAGLGVAVFEARDRVGGRVWSATLAGSTIERGAEFVLDGYDVMRAYAAEFGLLFADTGMSYYVREPRGGAPVARADLEIAAPRLRVALASAAPTTTVIDLLRDLPLTPGLREAIAARASISSAWPAEDLPASALADIGSGFDARPTFRLAGGNQALAVRLAARLVHSGGRVVLSRPIRSIRWGADDRTWAVVRTDRGEHAADAVVVAVPLAVLGQIAFEPKLPGWKNEALQQLTAGQAAKLHVPLADRATATSAVLSVPDRFWCWTATDASGTVPPVLNCFAGSEPALNRLRVAHGPERWLDRLTDLRRDLQLDGQGAILTTWHDDPWARMAYSALPAGRQPDPAGSARAVGPLHFAGEHTDAGHRGLMEGALRSGRRAAAEIIAAGIMPPGVRV